MEAWRIFNDGVRVILEFNGKDAKSIPWKHADEVANALRSNARICEQNEKKEQVIFDSAIIARTGLPIGFTSDPKMQDEARKESMYNRDIRRSNLPAIGSIPGQEVFGTPAITNTPSLSQLKAMLCQTSKH